MSRRKTPSLRKAQSKRNEPAREIKKKVIPAVEVFKHRQRAAAAEAKKREIGEIIADVLIAVSRDYHKGRVKYCALRPTSELKGKEMHLIFGAETLGFAQLPKSEQTGDALHRVGEIIKQLNQGWVDKGWLGPADLRLGELPSGRLYDDGRVEAVNRGTDMDIVDLGRRFRARLTAIKK